MIYIQLVSHQFSRQILTTGTASITMTFQEFELTQKGHQVHDELFLHYSRHTKYELSELARKGIIIVRRDDMVLSPNDIINFYVGVPTGTGEAQLDWIDSVRSRTVTVPPPDPVNKDRYVVPVNALGLWAGHGNDVAEFFNGYWTFTTPTEGTTTYVEDVNTPFTFTDTNVWRPMIESMSHNHDDRYYIKTESDARYAPMVHIHTGTDVGLDASKFYHVLEHSDDTSQKAFERVDKSIIPDLGVLRVTTK